MDSQKSIPTYYGFLLVKKINGMICGRFPLTKKDCTLGRDNSCDIRILLEKVSALQCSIICLDNKAYVRDKSVAGSTKVNGKKVGRSNFLLHDSDEIEICGRKFVWEYPKKPHEESNNLSCKKSGIRSSHLSPRPTERFPNQVNTPQDNNKIFSTSTYSSMKTPSKTILSINKTPIIVTTKNMSKSSFDEVQNNFQNQKSTTTAQSGSKLMKSYSMTPVQNIPLLDIHKTTQRKSWIVTNTSDNSSSIGAHNRLSTERLKRDSTPDLNSSYRYKYEDVEFDSPDPPCLALNNEDSVDINTTDLADNNFPVDNKTELNDNDDNTLQSNKNEMNQLSVSEPGTSRRDTYSVDNRPIIIEENTTPTPRRSILKCSKTTKPNRSRSTSRMVQFARLPKTDSKIKNTKTRLNPGFNFIVTDDENNVIDLNQSTTNSVQFDVEEYDDDLDGVQPLDISVSSLINSPILDNSISKSSKRGSRGNKVMSLVNSIEKRSNESLKHSIRASDLLSMNGSKQTDTSPNDDSQNNANILRESVSSTRRINLEDIFEAEDSLKSTCNIGNETLAQEIKESPTKSVEIVSSPKTNSFNVTDTDKIPDNVFTEDVAENGIHDLESEYTFASPLTLPKTSSSATVIDTDSTFVDSEKDFSSPEIIDNQFDTNSKLDMSSRITENCTTSTNEFLTKSDNVEDLAIDHELSSTLTHHDNIDETQKDKSNCYEKTVDEEICSDYVESPNNITELSEINKPIEKECDQKQNYSECVNDDVSIHENQQKQNDSECVNDVSTHENQQKQDDSECVNDVSTHEDQQKQNDSGCVNDDVCTHEDQPSKNDVEPVNKSTDLKSDQIDKQTSISKVFEQTLNGETPSIVVQSIAEMFDASIDEHETTHLQHKDSLDETYVLMDKDNPQHLLGVNKLKNVNLDECNKTFSEDHALLAEPVNKSLMEAIEVQLDKMHSGKDTSSNCNENETILVDSTLDLNKQKTLTSNLELKVTDSENITLIINDNLSNNSPNALTVVESTDIISKPNSPAKDNVSNKSLTDVDYLSASELRTRTAVNETNSVQNINVNSEASNTPIPSDNHSVKTIFPKSTKKKLIDWDQLRTALGANNSKELKKSVKSPLNKSVEHKHRKIDSTRRIAELCLSSSSDDDNEKDTKKKKLDHSLNTSFGKPRYESTPWNCSKSSKTALNSTANIQLNETTRNDPTENEDRSSDKSYSNSVTPFASQKEWSQMMKEFNESVHKASININLNINRTSISNRTQTPTKDSNIMKNTSEIKNNNSTQWLMKSSRMTNNTSYESSPVKRSMRNRSARVSTIRRSSRSNKFQISHVDNDSSSSETTDCDRIFPRKNNSMNNKIADKTNNKSVQANTNSSMNRKTDSEKDTYPCSQTKKQANDKKNSLKSPLPLTSVNKSESKNKIKEQDKALSTNEDSPASIDYEGSSTSSCINEVQTFERELRRRKLITTSSIKNKKNALNTDKVKTTKESKRIASSSKEYSTNTNALSESGILKLDKKNKNLIKSKSTKVSKTVKTKKSTNLRTNLNSRSKRILPSKPIETNTKDSSEYESLSETEETTLKLQAINRPSKSIKEKTSKKNVDIDNNLSSLSTRRSQRKKVKMSDVSMQSRTSSRKRAVKMSPLTQSNKDKRKNISSKVVANPVSVASNSPKKRSYILTRQNLVPDNSLPETTEKSSDLKSKKNSRILNRILPSKPIKSNSKRSSEDGMSTDTEKSTQKSRSIHHLPKSSKENTKKKDVIVDNNVSSLSTKRNLREKTKTSDVSLQPPKTLSRKRAADTSPLSQPKAKGKKCDISSQAANTVSFASNSPNIRTRNMSKSVKQVSNNSFPETTSKKETKKSNENTRTKKRQLNTDNCSFDSAPSTSKTIRQVTVREAESKSKKSDSTEPIASAKGKYNKNAEKSISPIQRKTRNAVKSISPIQRKTRKAAKEAVPKDKETFISPRVLRVRDKKK